MYFQAIRTLKNRLAKIDLDLATERALKARQEDISELNREQLEIGMRADGTFLPPYSANSVSKFGKSPGTIKLYDTGAFYAGIKPEINKTGFSMEDTDNKTDMLQEKYGDSILGLSDYSIAELAQDSLGQMQFELRQQL